MLQKDRVEERIEVLQADIAAVRNLSSSKKLEAAVDRLETDLDLFLDACKERMRERVEEAQNAEDLFDLRHRQLVGLAEEFSVLARKRPETSCKAFKARQVNLVLQPLKEEMEAYLKLPLCLVDEDGANSYSDVCLLIRNYLDLSAIYALRRYDLRYYEKAR